MRRMVREWLDRRHADHRRRILTAIAHGEAGGATIAKRSGLWTGVLYPMLMELERDGVLVSRWEERTGGDPKAPRTRLYRAVRPDCGPWG